MDYINKLFSFETTTTKQAAINLNNITQGKLAFSKVKL